MAEQRLSQWRRRKICNSLSHWRTNKPKHWSLATHSCLARWNGSLLVQIKTCCLSDKHSTKLILNYGCWNTYEQPSEFKHFQFNEIQLLLSTKYLPFCLGPQCVNHLFLVDCTRNKIHLILSYILSSLILSQMVLVVIFIIAVIMYRVLVSIPLFQNSQLRSLAFTISSFSAAVVNLILIMALGKVYEKLALKLTQWGKLSVAPFTCMD